MTSMHRSTAYGQAPPAAHSLPLASPLHPLAGTLALVQVNLGTTEYAAERLIGATKRRVEELLEQPESGLALLAFSAQAEATLDALANDADRMRRQLLEAVEYVQVAAAQAGGVTDEWRPA